MKKFSVFIIAILSVLVVLAAPAQEKKKEMKETTITGEVIDVNCCLKSSMMGGTGDDHKECAISCIKRGLPVGILEDKTEKVYLVLPGKGGGANSDTTITKFIAGKVKLTGTFYEKGGMKLFKYTNVEEMK